MTDDQKTNEIHRMRCFIGSKKEVGLFGKLEADDKYSCTHTADWCIEYGNRRIPDHTSDACHDHLVCLLDPSTINAVHIISPVEAVNPVGLS